jgi:hypothetical protein
MNGAPNPLLTKCRYCKQTWPPAIPVVGQPMDAAYFALVMQLCQHLGAKHPRAVAEVLSPERLAVSLRFSHLFYLSDCFDSADPELARYRDVSRHAIWSMLRKASISDATIEAKVKAVSWPNSRGTEVVALVDVIRLFKEVRDTLEERGLYPETKGEGAPLVIVAS